MLGIQKHYPIVFGLIGLDLIFAYYSLALVLDSFDL